jgi:hypothetical protein
MDLQRLARMVAEAQERTGMSDYALEHEIGRPGGRAFNAKQIDRWKKGLRTQPVPRAVVERLIVILGLDPDETWHVAEMWPPDLDLEAYRELRKAAPRQPALAHAVGGGGTPPASSLRPVHRAFSDQQGATTATLIVVAAERWRRAELGQVAA